MRRKNAWITTREILHFTIGTNGHIGLRPFAGHNIRYPKLTTIGSKAIGDAIAKRSIVIRQVVQVWGKQPITVAIGSMFSPGVVAGSADRSHYAENLGVGDRGSFENPIGIAVEVSAVEYYGWVEVGSAIIKNGGARFRGSRTLITAHIFPYTSISGKVRTPPATDTAIDTAGALEYTTEGKIRSVGEQAAIEGSFAGSIQQDFLGRGRGKGGRSIVDQQVAIGVARCLESDGLVGPVGFIYPPDPVHSIQGVDGRDRHRGGGAAIVVAPGQEAFVRSDGSRICQVAGSDGTAGR